MPLITRGQQCRSLHELAELLTVWRDTTSEPTISGGTDSRKGYLGVAIGGVECGLAGDTTRAGVQRFLTSGQATARSAVVPRAGGAMQRVAFGRSATPIHGFYLYTNEPHWRPFELDAPYVTAWRILDGVAALHRRGFQTVRALPGMSPSGTSWRVSVAPADNIPERRMYPDLRDWDLGIHYSIGAGYEFAARTVTASSTGDDVADLIIAAAPWRVVKAHDWAYAGWFGEMLGLAHELEGLPIAYDYGYEPLTAWTFATLDEVRSFPDPPRHQSSSSDT
ncbi:hypothetical protein J1G44_06150 [Cellulomonas sp. zg-ZUI199]|uniref:Aminoglycoside phosphotransferase domain-containing protein n=1 Tax=Cellulomonas wangleii TaxID=2816956 RepID=A0ABX8D3P5_9CELL|nr:MULTISPECIES: hypothetical protein [Cellulomonas]MBO0898935.1 hypothetical protein [Cellulomonas sp. zg-ZUI22]MBO0923778.1 hypothetical protein [Cellulomonas wangleii]MBO0924060.1 hypothetical protein [Cellulomonas wangleii]QVI62085.1 hypothetical protein KG103_16995 [Cellulomonas wangleii]